MIGFTLHTGGSIMSVAKIILLVLFVALPTMIFGCATNQMYINPDDCHIDKTGAFYICYYMKDGEVLSYKKSFNSRTPAQKEETK